MTASDGSPRAYGDEPGRAAEVADGVRIMGDVALGRDTIVGPNAVIGTTYDASSSRSRQTTIARGAFVGANATILSGIMVGAGAVVRPGAVVTFDVPPNAIVSGNPAAIVGYVDSEFIDSAIELSDNNELVVRAGASLRPQSVITDLRGSLTFAELNDGLPFLARRFFIVYGVPSEYVRGEHAHRTCHQLLVCVHGSCRVALDDGRERFEVLLSRPSQSLHVPPMIWATQYFFTSDAVLLVLASDPYDPNDYIRDYHEFVKARKSVEN